MQEDQKVESIRLLNSLVAEILNFNKVVDDDTIMALPQFKVLLQHLEDNGMYSNDLSLREILGRINSIIKLVYSNRLDF